VPSGEIISITGRVCFGEGACSPTETGYYLFSKTTSLLPNETKNLLITVKPASIPSGGITEVIYETIKFGGAKYQMGMTINPASTLSFLWGVGDYIYNVDRSVVNATVKATVVMTLKSWDNLTVLWTETKETASYPMSYLDDIDVGPLTFTLPTGLSGHLSGTISWSGVNSGAQITKKIDGVNVGVNPNPIPPVVTGTGVGAELQWKFSSFSAMTPKFRKGDTLTASLRIMCKLKAGAPDEDQYSRMWVKLQAKSQSGTSYWAAVVITPSQIIPADGERVFNLTYTLPTTVDNGTLSMEFGGDCITGWQFPLPMTQLPPAQPNVTASFDNAVKTFKLDFKNTGTGPCNFYTVINIKDPSGNVNTSLTPKVVTLSAGESGYSQWAVDFAQQTRGTYYVKYYIYRVPPDVATTSDILANTGWVTPTTN
jgi:hypothetical protein